MKKPRLNHFPSYHIKFFIYVYVDNYLRKNICMYLYRWLGNSDLFSINLRVNKNIEVGGVSLVGLKVWGDNKHTGEEKKRYLSNNVWDLNLTD